MYKVLLYTLAMKISNRDISGKKSISGGLMRISELARAAGVSVPTVHYYLKEGLLTAPVINSRNMAYYDPRCVDEIRSIKGLQSKRFLPLSIIKVMIQATRDGQQPDHLIEMSDFFLDTFQPVGNGKVSLSFVELTDSTGLSRPVLRAIEKLGLLTPTGSGGTKCYDDVDLHIAKTVKEMLSCGLTTRELGIYSEYMYVTRRELKTIHDKIHELHSKGDVPLARLTNAVQDLRHYLDKKARRRFIIEFDKEQGSSGKKKRVDTSRSLKKT